MLLKIPMGSALSESPFVFLRFFEKKLEIFRR